MVLCYMYVGFHGKCNEGAYLQLCPNIRAREETKLWESAACPAQQNRGSTKGSWSQHKWLQINAGNSPMLYINSYPIEMDRIKKLGDEDKYRPICPVKVSLVQI